MDKVTSASGVPSEKVMPPLMAEAFTAPAEVLPLVTFGVLSGWQYVFLLSPPAHP